jgi:hypothetical protein
MLGGYVLAGVTAFRISKKLFEAYPFGRKGRFWWSKYLPLFGFSLLLMAAGEPPLALIPGALLIIASIFFLQNSSSETKIPVGDR